MNERIVILDNIDDYKKYLNAVTEPTILYVKNLNIDGAKIYKDMVKSGCRIYSGVLRKHCADNWGNFYVTGTNAPEFHEFQFPNIKIRSYNELLKDNDYTKEQVQEALEYIQKNFSGEYGKMPKTPSSIVKHNMQVDKFMIVKDNMLIDFAHAAFQPGAVHVKPQYINKVIPFETHLDIRQAYAAILKTKKFPSLNYEYIDLTQHTDEEVEEIIKSEVAMFRIIGGKIKLKPHGFPLLQQSQSQKAFDLNKKNYNTMSMTNYDTIYDIGHIWKGITLTSPAFQVLLDNYDIIEPLEICDCILWKNCIKGIGINFIDRLYQLRTTTTNPALKNFAKLCNEYCAGMFQRKFSIMAKPWKDLEGTKKDGAPRRIPFNCVIGDFITDYLRLKISNMLKELPFDWVIGYDTDGIFLNVTAEELVPLVIEKLGKEPGTFHIDARYKDVIHLANKQYYGKLLSGKPFGKLAGIPNGDEVAAKLLDGIPPEKITTKTLVWNKEALEYEFKEEKIKIGKNYES